MLGGVAGNDRRVDASDRDAPDPCRQESRLGQALDRATELAARHADVREAAATLGTSFAHVTALPIAEPPDQLGNVVLLGTDRVPEIADERLGDPVATLPYEHEHWRVVQRMHAWANRFTPAGGRVLTDDWNPSDLRSEEINFATRRRTRLALPAALLGG